MQTGDTEHGHPESGDHSHADKHIGDNKIGAGVEGHTAVSRADDPAAQTRVVSMAGIWLGSWESRELSKG
jgi:hypothetical protein